MLTAALLIGIDRYDVETTLALPAAWTDAFIRSPATNLTRSVRLSNCVEFQSQLLHDAGQTIYQHGINTGPVGT